MKKIVLLIVTVLFLTSCNINNPGFDSGDINSANKMSIGAYSSGNRNPLAVTAPFNEPVNLLVYDSLYTLNEKFEAVENLASEMTTDRKSVV